MARWVRRVVLGVLAGWVVFSIGLILAVVLYGRRDAAHPADVIIVLGAGLNPDGTTTETFDERIAAAHALYEQGVAPRMICTGAILGESPRSEADACMQVLRTWGVPQSALLFEDQSRNTYENILYSDKVMTAEGLQTAVVVSSSYHLLRARWLAWRRGVDVTMSSASVDHLTRGQLAYSVFREWGAFHWQVLRDVLGVPHLRVPLV